MYRLRCDIAFYFLDKLDFRKAYSEMKTGLDLGDDIVLQLQ